jgi:putative Mg2+ transporter-C (MgtC) family protein
MRIDALMEAISAPDAISQIVIRLMAAVVLGAVIGVNRELQRKPAGLRTHALVALGAAAFTIVALLLEPAGNGASREALSRVLQGIVAGVGFIGAGAILHRDESKDVLGLTTAASIWVVAALAIAVASGLWWSALAVAVLTLVVLVVGEPIDRALHKMRSKGE